MMLGSIFRKELKSYFITPLGYIYLTLSTFLAGLFFAFMLTQQLSIDYNSLLMDMAFVSLFITPLLTMKLISDERKNSTDQLLYTSPIELKDVLMGKYFAGLMVYIIAMLITFIFPIILMCNGVGLDMSAIIISYLGYILLGGTFVAIGIFVSSLTENQAVAGFGTVGILIVFGLLEVFRYFINFSDKWEEVFDWFLLLSRYEDFNQGVLNISSIIYFVSIISLFLFLTYRVMEKRRWSRG